MASTSTFAISQLSLELANGQVTTEAHILPPGPFRSEDGRPVECAAWQLNSDIAARLIAKLAAKKTDTLIDYEHQSLRAEKNGKPVPAAGWFNQLRWMDAAGLFATGVGWTEDARTMIAKRQYRYISAVFAYHSVTGEIVEIISVALTNTPAIDGLHALADMALKHFSQPEDGEDDMAQDQPTVAALTVENSSLKSSVADLTKQRDDLNVANAALTKERDTLTTQVAALTKEKTEAAAAAEKKQHADLLAAALTDGRLIPAQKAWAEKQSLAALTEYLDATKPVAMLTKQADGKVSDQNHGLNAEELAMCTRMNVSPEDYAKTKTSK